MLFILKDWNRNWYLAFRTASGRVPGAVEDRHSARALLSHLLRDRSNLDTLRGWLASESPRGARPVPADPAGLLQELDRQLAMGRCVLARGEDSRSGGGGKRPAEEPELETWDFAPAGEAVSEAADAAPDEPLPALRFSGGSEVPVPLVLGYGSERERGPSLAYAAEGGPAFAFAMAAEIPRAFGNSVSVQAP